MEIIKILLIYSGIVLSTMVAVVVTEALYKTIKHIIKGDYNND